MRGLGGEKIKDPGIKIQDVELWVWVVGVDTE